MFWGREGREEARAKKPERAASSASERGEAGHSTAERAAGESGAGRGGENVLLRRRYRYVGQVQGVGFRWTSSQVANGLGLAGWVRNEPDGSVTVVLQGTQDQLGAFATRLAQAMTRYAHYAVTDREDEPVVAGDHEFKVRF